MIFWVALVGVCQKGNSGPVHVPMPMPPIPAPGLLDVLLFQLIGEADTSPVIQNLLPVRSTATAPRFKPPGLKACQLPVPCPEKPPLTLPTALPLNWPVLPKVAT